MTPFVPVVLNDSTGDKTVRYLFLLACNGSGLYEKASLGTLWGTSVHDLVKYERVSDEDYTKLIDCAHMSSKIRLWQPNNAGPWHALAPGRDCFISACRQRALAMAFADQQLAGVRLVAPQDLTW